jgi:ParB family chromosome partitioning protein
MAPARDALRCRGGGQRGRGSAYARWWRSRRSGWCDGWRTSPSGTGRGGTGPEVVVLRARDGAAAACHLPFPPLPPGRGGGSGPAGGTDGRTAADRTVGVLHPPSATPSAYSPATRRGWPPPRPGPGLSMAGPRRAAGHSTGSPAAARTRPPPRAPPPTPRWPSWGRTLPARRAGAGGDRRAMASLRADPGWRRSWRGRSALPHRARSRWRC